MLAQRYSLANRKARNSRNSSNVKLSQRTTCLGSYWSIFLLIVHLTVFLVIGASWANVEQEISDIRRDVLGRESKAQTFSQGYNKVCASREIARCPRTRIIRDVYAHDIPGGSIPASLLFTFLRFLRHSSHVSSRFFARD